MLWRKETGFICEDSKDRSIKTEKGAVSIEHWDWVRRGATSLSGIIRATSFSKSRVSAQLPASRETAYRRMISLERRFRKQPNLQQQFQVKIDHYLKSGYARKLTATEISIPSSREWFLPLFGTYHPNKPGKLRLIWDAAAKSNGKCLNDFLYTGPDLLASLPGILLKFRRGAIAFCGDIKEMFHQVRIRQEDCPAQRFL